MSRMFEISHFNQDISKWDVSSVENMALMLFESRFRGDISKWRPLSLIDYKDLARSCKAVKPYLLLLNSKEEIREAVERFDLSEKLKKEIHPTTKTSNPNDVVIKKI